MKKLILLSTLALVAGGVANAENKIVGTISTDGVKPSKYSALAKISMSEATAKASAAVSGKVTEAALENEDGYLVYSVEIVNADRSKSEVLIDAGNGAILATESDD
jgi:uncharacterized membrane protein YkoI